MSDAKNNPKSGDAVRPAILGIFLNLLRTSSLVTKLDMSEVLNFISNHWTTIYRNGALELEVVHAHLVGLPGVKPQEVAQILLLLKAREEKLGVIVNLPRAVAMMSAHEQKALADETSRIGVHSGVTLTNMRRTPALPPDSPRAASASVEGLTDKVRAILNKK